MVNELIFFALFSTLGVVGAFSHYYKKRYGDHTLRVSLKSYLFNNFKHTLIATGAMLFSEATIASTTHELSLAAIIAALTAGYTADSVLNKQ